MKRSVAAAPALPFVVEEPAAVTGWDPRAVWLDRVRDARAGAVALRSGVRHILAPSAARASSGWDPLETWCREVRGPRRLLP